MIFWVIMFYMINFLIQNLFIIIYVMIYNHLAI